MKVKYFEQGFWNINNKERKVILFASGVFLSFILFHFISFSVSLRGKWGAEILTFRIIQIVKGFTYPPHPLHIIIHYNSNHLCCFAVQCPLQPGLVVVPNDQHREGGVPAVVHNRFTTLLPLPAEENINVKNSPCVVSSPFYVTSLETCQA